MGFINLTPNEVVVGHKTFPPSGKVVTLQTSLEHVGVIDGTDLHVIDYRGLLLDGRPASIDDVMFEPFGTYIVDKDVALYIKASHREFAPRFCFLQDGILAKAAKTTIEPNLMDRWWAHGLECGIAVNPLGTLNGYVRIPKDHPFRFSQQQAFYPFVQVHGGITWGPDDDGWVGWDTLHAGDYIPDVQNGYEWDEAAVRAETEILAEQLSNLVE